MWELPEKDPCRDIPELAITVGSEALTPLGKEAWAKWVDTP